MSTAETSLNVRRLRPAQMDRFVAGLHDLIGHPDRSDWYITLASMDAPEVLPAGSCQGYESSLIEDQRIIMESTFRRSGPYQTQTFHKSKE